MRNRSSSVISDVTDQNVVLTTIDGTCSSPEHESSSDSVKTNQGLRVDSEMNDIVTPNFKKLVAQGVVINNPMDRTVTTWESSLVPVDHVHHHRKWDTTCSPDKYTHYGTRSKGVRPMADHYRTWSQFLAVSDSINVQSLIDRAVTQAWANVELSEADVLASIGEGKETVVSMIAIIKKVIKLAINAKKLRFKELRGQFSPSELKELWMEARYAIRPLVYDAKAVIAAYKFEEPEDRLTFRGYAEDYWSDSYTQREQISSATRYTDYVYQSSRSVQVRSGVLTQVKAVSNLNVWGGDKWIETMWELTPYSFIIDWFFNVGQTIASFTPEMGLDDLASWYVVHDLTYQIISITGSGINPCTWSNECLENRWNIGPGYMSKTVDKKYRVPNPKRSFVPSFKLKLDPAKLLDLVIIGRQRAGFR